MYIYIYILAEETEMGQASREAQGTIGLLL